MWCEVQEQAKFICGDRIYMRRLPGKGNKTYTAGEWMWGVTTRIYTHIKIQSGTPEDLHTSPYVSYPNQNN